jgi:hypothetical protein
METQELTEAKVTLKNLLAEKYASRGMGSMTEDEMTVLGALACDPATQKRKKQ